MNRRDVLGLMVSVSAAALAPRAVLAEGKYPDRPIRLIVPFSPGGVVDVIGRQWAEKMTSQLGMIIVENQGGGGGTIGTAEVARAKPDGYTILLGNTSTMVLNPAIMVRLPYDPIKNFTPISVIAISVSGIIVHSSVPAQNLQEFIAYAKANSSNLSYGSAGAGTMTNLAGELFKQIIGTPDIVHVPYKGAGPAIADLISGQIQMATVNVTGQLLDLHRAGKIRILAVASPNRLKGAPDIPTAIESGLPNMVAQLFNALFVPAGTPKPIVDQIDQASRKVLADVKFQKALINSGLEPILDSSPEQTQRFLQAEIARWTPIVKAAGMKIE